jgi:hypothetical protein
MFISISNFEMANERINYAEEKNKMNKEEAEMYAKNMLNSHEANEVNSRSAHPQMNGSHAVNGVNGAKSAQHTQPQVPSMQSMEPPQYSEPKHNVNGNMISFPQNSSDLTGFEADDKYLSIDKANVSDINYTSEYKLNNTANSVANYDGFDTTDKLSPY